MNSVLGKLGFMHVPNVSSQISLYVRRPSDAVAVRNSWKNFTLGGASFYSDSVECLPDLEPGGLGLKSHVGYFLGERSKSIPPYHRREADNDNERGMTRRQLEYAEYRWKHPDAEKMVIVVDCRDHPNVRLSIRLQPQPARQSHGCRLFNLRRNRGKSLEVRYLKDNYVLGDYRIQHSYTNSSISGELNTVRVNCSKTDGIFNCTLPPNDCAYAIYGHVQATKGCAKSSYSRQTVHPRFNDSVTIVALVYRFTRPVGILDI
ncbi:hypothetical protein DPMN_112906 [Dreissena polymorpha]|uniref:Uncharacterized protein n=1 Tax=Dreissena polymorpha TaxID=45954 RepID=A0A9D4QRC4_DREPO|nr:hypothetical protein DPMN_112906 [Dreissena polymorpha]